MPFRARNAGIVIICLIIGAEPQTVSTEKARLLQEPGYARRQATGTTGDGPSVFNTGHELPDRQRHRLDRLRPQFGLRQEPRQVEVGYEPDVHRQR